MVSDLKIQEKQARLPVLSIVKMLWKRKLIAIILCSVSGILSFLYARQLPSIYKAEAIVLVDAQKIPENFVSSTVSGDIADRLGLISQDIMSSASLLEIIRQHHLYDEQKGTLTQDELLRKMHEDISVNVEKSWTGGRMQAFRIAYQERDPKTVADVTNRLARLYVEENLRARQNEAEGTVDFLRSQLRQAKASLDEQESKVAQFKQEHTGFLPQQENSLLSNLSDLRLQLQGLQDSVARGEETLPSLEAALSAAESSEEMTNSNSIHNSSANAGGGDRLGSNPPSTALEEQLRVLLLRYTPHHPEVEMLRNEIRSAKLQESSGSATALGRLTKVPAGGMTNGSDSESRNGVVNQQVMQARERVEVARAQLETTRRHIASLEKPRSQILAAIADCEAKISRLPLVEQQMASLKRDYDESANNYNSLLQKELAAGVATDLEHTRKSERFTIVDPARVPQKPIKPKRPVLIIAGTLAGLILGLLISFGLEYRSNRLQGEWELPEGTIILGRVPRIELSAAGS